MEKDALVYEIDWLLDYIYKESDKLIHKITDTTRFEDRCIKEIGEYLSIDDSNKHKRRYLIRLVNRKVKEALDNFRQEESELFTELSSYNKEEDEMEFEPEDVLADVESEVIAKEMTALLAQGDHLLEEIVGYWAIGNTNNASISRSLARTFGGNAESHRRRINRFRHDCRKHLSAAV